MRTSVKHHPLPVVATGSPKKSNASWRGFTGIQAYGLMAAILLSCSGKIEKVKPSVRNITESVYASGTVKAKNQYEVFTTVTGTINNMVVSEGDSVKPGDVLVSLRHDVSALNSMNARLASEYEDVKANESKLAAGQANMELAKARMVNDSLLLVRQRNLWTQGVGSRVDLEQREITYLNATTTYRISKLNYADLKKQLQFADVQSKTNWRISTALEDDYLIRSRVNGKVYKILKEKGELANPQQPIAIVGDAHDFLLELNVDEYDIPRLQPGQRIILSLDSYKGQVFEGRVREIEPLMNEASRSFTVKADFVTQPGTLYPNLSAEANIIIRTKEKALTIPRSYLLGDSLVILANGQKRKVSIGARDYQYAEIVDGISQNDVIQKPLP
jgi:RND family efflux transporter MFP subunit